MILTITVCATRDYTYAIPELAARVQANLAYANLQARLIMVGDESPETATAFSSFAKMGLATCELITLPLPPSAKNYQTEAQNMIARMRGVAFMAARACNSNFCWSLDSDVLPPENALECMLGMLAFDKGFYGVAACPYPSQGGGDFLCGRGTPQRTILPDATPEERTLPPRLQRCLELRRERAKAPTAAQKEYAKLHRVERMVEKCPPKADIFELNSKGNWKRRGWFSAAYPAIGLGSVVPSDWCGFGCTLMNRNALAAASFDGYEGKGTEDLYIVWRRWHPKGIRIAAIPHAPCDHVIRARARDGSQDLSKLVLVEGFHEQEGECVGHLRQRRTPFNPAR